MPSTSRQLFVAKGGAPEPETTVSCVVCLECAVVSGEECLYRVMADDERVSAR